MPFKVDPAAIRTAEAKAARAREAAARATLAETLNHVLAVLEDDPRIPAAIRERRRAALAVLTGR